MSEAHTETDAVSIFRPRKPRALQARTEKRVKPLLPSRKIAQSLDLMIHEGLTRPEAAQRVGLTDHALRCSFKKPHVLAYIKAQKDVLRTSAGAAALHQIAHLSRKAGSEKVQLEASIYLDSGPRQGMQVNVGVRVQTPGYVLDLRDQAHDSPQMLELTTHEPKPLSDKDDVTPE